MEGTTYTIVKFETAGGVEEIFIQGHHAAEFTVGVTLYMFQQMDITRTQSGHVATAGATAYTQDENSLNDLLAF